MTVDTTKVTNRRSLRFESLEDIYRDAERLAATPHQRLGNWSLGQICQHLALAMNLTIDGGAKPASLPLRFFARLIRGRMLKEGMRPGFKLRPPWTKQLEPKKDDASAEEGLRALRTGIDRLNSTDHREPHFAFGKMTNEQWTKLHLRHSEMHLSFIIPDE